LGDSFVDLQVFVREIVNEVCLHVCMCVVEKH
jgi:hypothetical protein